MLVDTDVLIWYMRGNEKACQLIEDLRDFSISVVTYMELVQGLRNKKELHALRKALKGWNTRMLYISEEISAKAMFYVEQHFLSHAMHISDALIGATAIAHGIPVITGNDRHYSIIRGLQIKKFTP